MERELKFRVWNGSEMVTDVTVGKFGVFYVNPSNNGLDPNDSASITPFTTKYHEDTPVMQYTGLKDKNGTEIWEGDIVEWWDSYGVSHLGNDAFVTREEVIFQNGMFVPACGLIPAEIEVIGNVWQNPELINKATS